MPSTQNIESQRMPIAKIICFISSSKISSTHLYSHFAFERLFYLILTYILEILNMILTMRRQFLVTDISLSIMYYSVCVLFELGGRLTPESNSDRLITFFFSYYCLEFCFICAFDGHMIVVQISGFNVMLWFMYKIVKSSNQDD